MPPDIDMDVRQKYVVVEFLEEQPPGAAIVNDRWLYNQSLVAGSKKCQVYWPPTKNGDKILHMINQDVQPDPETWTSWKVNILYQSDVYSKAQQALIKAQDETDVDYTSGGNKEKRRPRPNRRFMDSSSEEEESVPVLNKKKKSSNNQRLPQPPEFSVMPGPSNSQNAAPPLRRSPRKSPVKSSVASPRASTHRSILQTSPTVQKSAIPELKCLCIKVEALKEEVKANSKVLRHVLHIITQGREEEEVEPNDMPSLPLNHVEEMTALNDALKDASKRKYFMSMMSKVGGGTVVEAVNRQLQTLMEIRLANKYNWKGQRGDKVKFCMLKGVIGVIFDAVRSNPGLHDTKLKDVEEAMKRYLRYAYQRLPKPLPGPRNLQPAPGSPEEMIVEEAEAESN